MLAAAESAELSAPPLASLGAAAVSSFGDVLADFPPRGDSACEIV
jgi:hypothetical protein